MNWTPVRSREDVTEEIREIARDVVEFWYAGSPIDWEDFWSRLDERILNDGTCLDTGEALDSPAQLHIRNVIRKERRDYA